MSKLAIAYILIFFCFADSYLLVNKETGIETVLPYENWQFFKQETEISSTYIYSLGKSLTTRFAILIFKPDVYHSHSMKERSQEINMTSLELYQEISISSELLAQKRSERLIYTLGDSYVIEYGFQEEDSFTIIQLATHISLWQTQDLRKSWENVFIHFRWNTKSVPQKNKASFEDIIDLRKHHYKNTVLVKEHDIKISFKDEYLELEDTILLETKRDTSKIQLYTSLPNIEKVIVFDKKYDLQWYLRDSKMSGINKLHIELVPSLQKQKNIAITIVAKIPKTTNDFFCGSFYYPNTFFSETLYKFTFSIPQSFDLCISTILKPDSSDRNYQQNIRSAYLTPINFVLGHFAKEVKFVNNMQIHLIAEAGVLKENVAIITKILGAMEQIAGKNIFDFVFIVMVPGKEFLAINSPSFLTLYNNWEEQLLWEHVAEDENLENIITALAKLWLLDMSTELKEGISQYYRLRIIEQINNKEAYDKAIYYLKQKYQKIISETEEFAIAHPQTWETLDIAKCKAPLVFVYLQNKMGKDNFDSALQGLLKTKINNYKTIVKSFSQKNKDKDNVILFFKKWFFQAGYPMVEVSWEQRGMNTHIYLKQLEDTYLLDGTIKITTLQKVHVVPIKLYKTYDHFMIIVPEKIEKIEFLLE